ncbi:MAG: helix-turn-helix domain-containing protein, partial [Gemmatimonadales bacterium]
MSATGETMDRLLAAATELFAEHGCAGVSIRAITRRAHVYPGAVRHHFGAKAALYEAAVNRACTELEACLAQAAAGTERPLDRVEQLLRAGFRYARENPSRTALALSRFTDCGSSRALRHGL